MKASFISISQSWLLVFGLLVVSHTPAESPDSIKYKSTAKINLSRDAPPLSEISFSVFVYQNAGWTQNEVFSVINRASQIYDQECRVTLEVKSVRFATVDRRLHYLTQDLQEQLLMELGDRSGPVVFFIDKTSEGDLAYAYTEGTASPSQGTVWLTREAVKECRGAMLAHELGHIALELETHSSRSNNLMNRSCQHSNVSGQLVNTNLTLEQCATLWRKYGQY